MTPDQLAELKNDATLRARLAKRMARDCFRNTILEDFHAGKVSSSQTGDYSDVKVVTPYGEIHWNALSRISDTEMKALMIDIVDHCYDFLMELCSPNGREVIENLKLRDELRVDAGAHKAQSISAQRFNYRRLIGLLPFFTDAGSESR